MNTKKITAANILENLSTYDLWDIGIQEVCHAIARALNSKKYGLVRKNGPLENIKMKQGLTEKVFGQRLEQKEKPLFTMHDGKDTHLMYFFDVLPGVISTEEHTSVCTILKIITKALQMRSVSKERIVETQIINQLNLNVTTALDENKIVTTLETAARQLLGIEDIYLFYIINDAAIGSTLTLHLTDIPKRTYDQLFRVQQIFTVRRAKSVFTRLQRSKDNPPILTFIPFTIKNEVRGFFVIFQDILNNNKTYGITRLRFLANQAALAMERIDLFRALNRTLKESQGIQELVKIMLSSLDLSSLFNEILQRAQKILGFKRILFSLLDPKTDSFTRVAGVGISATKLKRAQKIHPPRATIESLFLNRYRISNSYYIPAVEVSRIRPEIKEYELYTHPPSRHRLAQVWDAGDIFVSPVYSKLRALVAVLSLDRPANNLVPTIEQVRLLETFGDFFGMAIENTQLFEKIEELSNTDELTGIRNYRYLRERIAKLIDDPPTPFTLVLIDLDNFKTYNDRYGHVRGDRVLRTFAQNLTNALGKQGLAVRYGGDEFILLLPRTSIQRAEKILQDIQLYMKKHMNGKKKPPVPFTFGTANHPKHGQNIGTLIDRADHMLYERKAKKKK